MRARRANRLCAFSAAAFAALLGSLLAAGGCSHEYRTYESSAIAKTWELGGKQIELEVAKDAGARRQGLMFRKSMPADHGMLFVYPEPRVLGFWMQNTAIPLSIAFFEELPEQPGKARIINIEDMEPMVESTTSSLRPSRLALEMNQGWFARHGVKAGDVVDVPSWIQEIVAGEDP
jgi:uncharacterized membrane protein (UPF0127 family)